MKLTAAAEWHQANFPKSQVNSISKRIIDYQLFIDTKLQVSSSTGPTGTSTPSCHTSTDSQSGEVTPFKNKVKSLETILNFKIAFENSDVKDNNVGNESLKPHPLPESGPSYGRKWAGRSYVRRWW